jgi:hypothetical protein
VSRATYSVISSTTVTQVLPIPLSDLASGPNHLFTPLSQNQIPVCSDSPVKKARFEKVHAQRVQSHKLRLQRGTTLQRGLCPFVTLTGPISARLPVVFMLTFCSLPIHSYS